MSRILVIAHVRPRECDEMQKMRKCTVSELAGSSPTMVLPNGGAWHIDVGCGDGEGVYWISGGGKLELDTEWVCWEGR